MDNKQIQEEDSIDLLEIFDVLRRHVWIIVLCTVASALVGFIAVTFFATPKYQASSSMIVNSRQENTGNLTSDQLNSASRLVATYSVIIRSNKVLQVVIDDLGLDYTADELKEMVSVSAVNDTQVMAITVTSTDPREAYRICTKISQIAPDLVKKTVDAGSANVVDSPKLQEDPVSPHVRRDIVIMALLGAILSIGVIIVVHLFDNKINNESDVAKYLNLSVLGVIPFYDLEKK